MFLLTASASLMAAMLGTVPAAASCLGDARDMAAAHELTIDPPGATMDAPRALSPQLEESGGVIQPPPTGDAAVIEPPQVDTGMETLPALPERSAEPGEPDAGEPGGSELAIVQTILTAARQQALVGDEQGCLDRLAEARQLLNDGS